MTNIDGTVGRNPFPSLGKWWFHDENGKTYGPYPTQMHALKHLMKYITWLDNGPTIWQSLWWPVRYTFWRKIVEFWHDTRGTR